MDLLSKDQLRLLKRAFETMDSDKKGVITSSDLGTILDSMGQHQNDAALVELVNNVDYKGEDKLNFEQVCQICFKFMAEEEEDIEQIRDELREAFLLYDKEGNGYITTEVLREILEELDNKLTDEELDQMIDEIDADGSGTVDFEEFMEVMTG